MNAKIVISYLISFLLFAAHAANAQAPVLRFTDLDSGPSSGLGDGEGSGTIVTVWGQYLGSAQGESSIRFIDSDGAVLDPAHIYYWKNADGQLPGGPADLYSSHRMQEIAFSIPSAPNGDSRISVIVDGLESNSLPFRVRSIGNIYWVAPNGNNNNSGSYNSPMAYVNADIGGSQGGIGDQQLSAGDIVYSRGVTEPDLSSGGRNVGMYLRSAEGTAANPISIVAYPGTRARIVAEDKGLLPYVSDYINLAKYDIRVGHESPTSAPDPGVPAESESHITAKRGRYVGNFMGQIAGTCITGWSGSITSGADGGENAKIYGNEISGLGCPNSSRFQHTTYMSVRSPGSNLAEAWDFSFNYLHDNFPMFGVHFYDEQINSGDCGGLEGTLIVSNNVILNQWGAAINIQTRDRAGAENPCWSADIVVENNVISNVGLGEPLDDNVTPQPQAIRIGGAIAPQIISVRNNTIMGWGSSTTLQNNGGGQAISVGHHDSVNPVISIENNVFLSGHDYPFVNTSRVIDESRNNLFFSTATTDLSQLVPNWPGTIIADPQLQILGSIVSVPITSPLIDAAVSYPGASATDIYGSQRGILEVGAVENPNPPEAPQLSE